jgi:hypothetical protein
MIPPQALRRAEKMFPEMGNEFLIGKSGNGTGRQFVARSGFSLRHNDPFGIIAGATGWGGRLVVFR